MLLTDIPANHASDLDLLTAVIGNRRHATRMLANANGSVLSLFEGGNSTGAAPAQAEADCRARHADLQYKLRAARELFTRAVAEHLRRSDALTSPAAVRALLVTRLAALPHEVFAVLLLDAQHRLIECVELFRGTLAQTSVYPREVVKTALAANAASVIFAHNHPSGVAEPSRADELLTQSLKQALGTVDVRVLDHFVVAGTATISFAERGLL